MIALTHLYKLRTLSMLKWVSPNSIDRNQIQLRSMGFVFCIAQNLRFYCKEGNVPIEICESLPEASVDNSQKIGKITHATRKRAQAALLEYLHFTRSIRYTDAENMSLNSPHFLAKLLQKVDIEADIGHSVTNFLRYHPINEFEPFLESLGLKPYEFVSLLPRDLMFLSDDALLLENYYVLCNYGIPRNKIGRIYREATEVFRCECGILELKLQAYEQLGLSQSFVCKLVACSPYLLVGDVNLDFMKVFEILKKGKVEFGSLEGHLLEKSYNWSQMRRILNIFRKTGYSEEQLGDLMSQHPGILFERSGNIIFSLIGFLFKFGSSVDQIWCMFLQFPHMEVAKFVSNLRRCFLFLTEIEMEISEIRKIVCSHTILIGSFTLKKTNTILVQLNVWKKRLCKLIQDNPQEMKKWGFGSRIERLPDSGEELRSRILKIKFLLDIGMAENQDKMEKALKLFRGRGTELQERFDCIMKTGLDRKDVCEMVRISPEILNQKKEVIEKKIDFYVNHVGYPLSYLVTYPSYLNYSIQRVKLRLAMYNWLNEQGTVNCPHALSTVIASAETLFVRRFVKHHPRGPEIWQDLKKLYPQ